jgi:SprT-like family
VQVQSTLLFESVEQIYGRVFQQLRPRSVLPEVAIRYCRFANVNNFIRFADERLEVRIADVLEGAPAPIQEALAFILVGKLFRKPVSGHYAHRYRLWLNRSDVRRQVSLLRRVRGRKLLAPPKGDCYDLEPMFDDLNLRFFGGLMARPALGWSRRPSRTMLGHYDPAHHAIVLSKSLDRPEVPRVAVEYVLYHEMLHLRHPTEHKGARRCVHTAEFKAAEKLFPALAEARSALKRL